VSILPSASHPNGVADHGRRGVFDPSVRFGAAIPKWEPTAHRFGTATNGRPKLPHARVSAIVVQAGALLHD